MSLSVLSFLVLVFGLYFAFVLRANTPTTQLHYLRLLPGDDLKLSLLAFAEQQKVRAGTVITCVGSLSSVRMRLASATASINSSSDFLFKDENFEIVSLVGTFEHDSSTPAYGHFHISVADRFGATFGGHLLPGSIVYTTAELVLLTDTAVSFNRVFCLQSRYKELKVQQL